MPSDDLGRNLITPQDQTLRQVFSAQRSYFIDIYQREYKWKDDNVQALLNDIEVRFNKHQRLAHDAKDIAADVLARFEPYFLNTYLTHSTPSRTYVVDGQQRLTTLLLILIKLYRILQVTEESPEPHPRVFSSKKLEQLIFESDDLGDATRFKIFNENREEAFRALIAGKYAESKDETRRRIAENFGVVSRYLDAFLQSGSDGSYDYVKLNYYLVYLLDRVSIVEIRIERQDNVAMIFEVVNDRGLGLKPYEILKGKLLGTLSAEEKETANRIWTDLQERYFAVELKNTTDKTLDLDSFFQTYFRAKFADTETEYDRFEGSYHYEMY